MHTNKIINNSCIDYLKFCKKYLLFSIKDKFIKFIMLYSITELKLHSRNLFLLILISTFHNFILYI